MELTELLESLDEKIMNGDNIVTGWKSLSEYLSKWRQIVNESEYSYVIRINDGFCEYVYVMVSPTGEYSIKSLADIIVENTNLEVLRDYRAE